MNGKDENAPFDSKLIENWFEQFFLDPLTTYLDKTVFRIDLFGTENEFIVEALLPSCQKENIHVAVNGQELSIKVKDHKKNHPHSHNYKIRTVTFPMSIDELKIDTRFEHDILEIKLYKKDK
jgi:HSP20 family molecular chaperone IbpA